MEFEEVFERAKALTTQRRFEEATIAYRDALAARPLHLESYLNLGLVLQAQDKLDEAVAAYEAAVTIAPNFAEAHLRLGEALCQTGNELRGVASLRHATAIESQNARMHVHLAQALLGMGDLVGAEQAFRRGLDLDPAHTEARANFSTLLLRTAKIEEARTLLDYPNLVRSYRIEGAESFIGLDALNEELARLVYAHPTITRDPAATATRAGSQTLEIFEGRERSISILRRFIEERVTEYLDSVLPLAGIASPAAWRINGWAVVLRSGGHQMPHFHPAATVSGVYYVRVPEIVKAGGAGEAGYLKFEQTGASTEADSQAPSYSVKPEEGKTVLFPSWLLHHTVPFESHEERISVAFDAVPANSAYRGVGDAQHEGQRRGIFSR